MDIGAILNLISFKVFRLVTAFLLIIGLGSAPSAGVVNPPVRPDTSQNGISTTTNSVSGGDSGATTTPEISEKKQIDIDFIKNTTLVDLEKKIGDLSRQINEQLLENTSTESVFSISDINNNTRKALVNILCISSTPKLGSITGSGVFVDPRGVILTNAHIGQYFLLKDYPTKDSVDCTIRTGNPARPTYEAKLVYLPPKWIADNPDTLKVVEPTGTGEHDYAFLLVTEPVAENISLPSPFPYVQMFIGDADLNIGDSVVLAGYAAGFLGGVSVQKDLYPVSAISKIYEFFTFADNSLDLLSLGGSVVAQKGSSGGAVVNENDYLVGLIVTSTNAINTEDRDLRAITISHINRSLIKNRGSSISAFLLGDIRAKADNYNSTEGPNLSGILIGILDK